MNSFAKLALASVVGLVVCVWLLSPGASSPPSQKTPASVELRVYCAAGLKAAVEPASAQFENETGIAIRLQYGGSGSLLSSLAVSPEGDVFIPADDSYLAHAASNGWVQLSRPVASMNPVLAVAKGNPRQLRTLEDLLKPGLRLALANPDVAAVGKVTRDRLQTLGHWASVEKQAIVFKPTVNDVANDIKLGAVDAGIIWDATAAQYPELEPVPLKEFEMLHQQFSVVALSRSKHPAAAEAYATYLTTPGKGLEQFRRRGYRVPSLLPAR